MQVQFYLTRVRGFAIGVVVYKPSYEFDDVINNNGTLEDLDSEVLKINTDYVATEQKPHQNFDLV
jgi:hypothetical protein